MKQSKTQRLRTIALAGRLLKASLVNGVPSPERVAAVLALVGRRPNAEKRPLLTAYARLMRRHEFLRTLSIERAGALDAASRESLVAALKGDSQRPLVVRESENPALIAGLRVRLGDDVFDASLAGTLSRLAS